MIAIVSDDSILLGPVFQKKRWRKKWLSFLFWFTGETCRFLTKNDNQDIKIYKHVNQHLSYLLAPNLKVGKPKPT